MCKTFWYAGKRRNFRAKGLGSAAPRWQDELDSALQLRENEPHAAIRWQPESLVLQEWLILLAMTGLLVYCRLGV